jgi:hypothetical protein
MRLSLKILSIMSRKSTLEKKRTMVKSLTVGISSLVAKSISSEKLPF